ncbi:O-antigen translocase [Aureitalea sp. L0-47]|uniref:O-antigen translocase n=1 Tax=Aureitalea sp. L0-47 TaxID=2816962 RepID=UPI0022370CE6|nr:O-antigen translocase [Aureitalea sp. L0-47]MCW5520698.1 O-antigen translocase [Aureitalea sp. L0-47]
MSDQKSSYRQVMKATSLFGGVQVFNILISIVRSKFIALFIGPEGMGIAGLLNTTLNLVNGATNLGLDKSGVKDISYSLKNGTDTEVARTVKVLRRLVWITGVVGAVLMMVFSWLLSKLAFGDTSFSLAFVWIALALLFKQLASGELAVLQGLRKLKHLASANVFGNLAGLIITVPLYYFFRLDAIVPAIIISTLLSFAFTSYYRAKTKLEKVEVATKNVFSEGKEMVKLGITLSVSSMIALLAAYIIQIYISSEGGVSEVGYYTAGIVILNTYVGLIFNAMATDYFPRLSAITDSMVEVRKTVFEQAYIAVLLITPIILLFLVFAPLIITILYSGDFLPVVIFVSWGILGMLFKAASWSIGYVIIAKGDSSLFIKTAIGFSALLVASNVLGYNLGGLEGLGISFCIYYFVHFVGLAVITYFRYSFYLSAEFYGIFIVCTIMVGAGFAIGYLEGDLQRYVFQGFLALLSVIFTVYFLNKKMDIAGVIRDFINRRKK